METQGNTNQKSNSGILQIKIRTSDAKEIEAIMKSYGYRSLDELKPWNHDTNSIKATDMETEDASDNITIPSTTRYSKKSKRSL